MLLLIGIYETPSRQLVVWSLVIYLVFFSLQKNIPNHIYRDVFAMTLLAQQSRCGKCIYCVYYTKWSICTGEKNGEDADVARV